MFITFEGGEGTGKSTQAKMLVEYLKTHNKEVILTREPGGTPGAELIRSLLVTGPIDKWLAKSEALLLYAARYDHWEKLIRPALNAKKWVVCDRFADSTTAYQGHAQGFDIHFLKILYEYTIGTCEPDLTFILDIDPQEGLQRAKKRIDYQKSQEGRFETMDIAFHERLRNGFLHIAQQYPNRCKVISANQPPEMIHQQILSHIKV